MESTKFHQNLNELLKKNNCSKNKLAIKIGISPSNVTTWYTRGHTPNIGVAAKIAKYFNVSLDWLCGLKTEVVDEKYISKDPILNRIIDNYNALSMKGKYYLEEYTETLTYNPNFKKSYNSEQLPKANLTQAI